MSVRIVWGFMLENTYFTEFDTVNHQIIEDAYRQRRSKPASYYITINDSHLSATARIYFGVAQVHLRMPGTRYYVKRKVTRHTLPIALNPFNEFLSPNVCYGANCWCMYIPGYCEMVQIPNTFNVWEHMVSTQDLLNLTYQF